MPGWFGLGRYWVECRGAAARGVAAEDLRMAAEDLGKGFSEMRRTECRARAKKTKSHTLCSRKRQHLMHKSSTMIEGSVLLMEVPVVMTNWNCERKDEVKKVLNRRDKNNFLLQI
ncbi:aldehyde dehydrogenase-like protein yneI [Striga asiatica]|uniref:Aldehyde dehydrogenase-like protein yneI n=1 Tax=Striga asiatica TaxID=4170 RepID=A0A5A7PCN0_STRAF|nr:aldehyde dehydrogenase-like protein yneI [Striga asiatica]